MIGTECEDASAKHGVKLEAGGGLLGVPHVRHGYENGFAVGRAAPLNSTERASLPSAGLPHNVALPIWVEGVHHSGFLADRKDAPVCSKRQQHRR